MDRWCGSELVVGGVVTVPRVVVVVGEVKVAPTATQSQFEGETAPAVGPVHVGVDVFLATYVLVAAETVVSLSTIVVKEVAEIDVMLVLMAEFKSVAHFTVFAVGTVVTCFDAERCASLGVFVVFVVAVHREVTADVVGRVVLAQHVAV